MEPNRKELELLLRSLQPAGLSEQTIARLEQAVSGSFALDPALDDLEMQLQKQTPRALSEATLTQMMATVRDVPFALDRKVLLFPGARKEAEVAPRQQSRMRRLLAVAAVATLGGLAALWNPAGQQVQTVAGGNATAPSITQPGVTPANGIVATSYGTGIERAADEGVIWTQDHQPKRVLRFQYQDRVLVRDKNGVDRMLLIPREELFVVPEKVD
jgi:hypothetical protein